MSLFTEVDASVLSGSVDIVAQHVHSNNGISTNASVGVPGLSIYGDASAAHAAMNFVEPTIVTGAAVAGQGTAPDDGAYANGYIQVTRTVSGTATTCYIPFFNAT
ncbi:MAG: hypothetical protein K0U52_08320 [Gammaproteobacteria bacterium]|nr:hypothetical protein [Gammaproteobacteria bacterium]